MTNLSLLYITLALMGIAVLIVMNLIFSKSTKRVLSLQCFLASLYSVWAIIGTFGDTIRNFVTNGRWHKELIPGVREFSVYESLNANAFSGALGGKVVGAFLGPIGLVIAMESECVTWLLWFFTLGVLYLWNEYLALSYYEPVLSAAANNGLVLFSSKLSGILPGPDGFMSSSSKKEAPVSGAPDSEESTRPLTQSEIFDAEENMPDEEKWERACREADEMVINEDELYTKVPDSDLLIEDEGLGAANSEYKTFAELMGFADYNPLTCGAKSEELGYVKVSNRIIDPTFMDDKVTTLWVSATRDMKKGRVIHLPDSQFTIKDKTGRYRLYRTMYLVYFFSLFDATFHTLRNQLIEGLGIEKLSWSSKDLSDPFIIGRIADVIEHRVIKLIANDSMLNEALLIFREVLKEAKHISGSAALYGIKWSTQLDMKVQERKVDMIRARFEDEYVRWSEGDKKVPFDIQSKVAIMRERVRKQTHWLTEAITFQASDVPTSLRTERVNSLMLLKDKNEIANATLNRYIVEKRKLLVQYYYANINPEGVSHFKDPKLFPHTFDRLIDGLKMKSTKEFNK